MHQVRSLAFSLRCGGMLVLATALAGCSDEDPAGPVEETFGSLTVDAVADWSYVDLAATASEVQPSDPAASTAWDIAFFASGVMLNGGAAGAGDVEGYCLCQNENATDAQVLAMTAQSELAAFEAVTAASIPTDENAWQSDALDPALAGWWRYDMASHTVTPVPDRVWVVRTAEGDAFAKVHVTALANGTQQSAGEVTLEFATQTAAGGPYGATRTLTVDVTAGPVYVDLLDGAVSDASDWDLRLQGYDIRLNGGVSGSGDAAAVLAGGDFDTIPAPNEIQGGFATDAYGGVFVARPWYRYDLQGNHQIWPTYNVYLIRTGDEVYKVQLVSYYKASNGDARHITFRYAPLTD